MTVGSLPDKNGQVRLMLTLIKRKSFFCLSVQILWHQIIATELRLSGLWSAMNVEKLMLSLSFSVPSIGTMHYLVSLKYCLQMAKQSQNGAIVTRHFSMLLKVSEK